MTSGTIYCNRCGAQNSTLAKFCANCGTPFTLDLQAAPGGASPEVIPRSQGPATQPAYSVPATAIRYGGFWIRFVAVVIDAILIAIVIWPFSLMVGLIIGLTGSAVSMPGVGARS